MLSNGGEGLQMWRCYRPEFEQTAQQISCSSTPSLFASDWPHDTHLTLSDSGSSSAIYAIHTTLLYTRWPNTHIIFKANYALQRMLINMNITCWCLLKTHFVRTIFTLLQQLIPAAQVHSRKLANVPLLTSAQSHKVWRCNNYFT